MIRKIKQFLRNLIIDYLLGFARKIRSISFECFLIKIKNKLL